MKANEELKRLWTVSGKRVCAGRTVKYTVNPSFNGVPRKSAQCTNRWISDMEEVLKEAEQKLGVPCEWR